MFSIVTSLDGYATPCWIRVIGKTRRQNAFYMVRTALTDRISMACCLLSVTTWRGWS